MLAKLKKSVCIALVVSTGCLPLGTLHAQTTSAANSAVVYNDQGNITSDSQSSQYRYNALNQLIYDQATQSSKTINYQYYATGMQANESVAPGPGNTLSTTLYHYYAGQGQLLNSVQDNNFSGYLLANGMTLRSYQSANDSQAQIYVRNRHSSVITTISSKTIKTQQYNAYGASTLNGASSAAKTPEVYDISTNPLGYSNYSFDVLANIYYLKARYYTPIYRTFLSRDSNNLNNRYFYVNGNPVILADPTGHYAEHTGWFSNAWHIATIATIGSAVPILGYIAHSIISTYKLSYSGNSSYQTNTMASIESTPIPKVNDNLSYDLAPKPGANSYGIKKDIMREGAIVKSKDGEQIYVGPDTKKDSYRSSDFMDTQNVWFPKKSDTFWRKASNYKQYLGGADELFESLQSHAANIVKHGMEQYGEFWVSDSRLKTSSYYYLDLQKKTFLNEGVFARKSTEIMAPEDTPKTIGYIKYKIFYNADKKKGVISLEDHDRPRLYID